MKAKSRSGSSGSSPEKVVLPAGPWEECDDGTFIRHPSFASLHRKLELEGGAITTSTENGVRRDVWRPGEVRPAATSAAAEWNAAILGDLIQALRLRRDGMVHRREDDIFQRAVEWLRKGGRKRG